MADVDDRSAILAYHEATKHSPVSVRTRAHYLDWDNRPSSFKVYTDLERIPLQEDIPSLDVPALEAIGVTSVLHPTPGPDLAALARLLVLGAGVHHTKTFREGEVPYFRNYASAGALYPVEVYVGCADLPGLPAGVYHFDPQGPTLTRLREGDHRGHLVRAAAGEPVVARAPLVLVLTGIPWRTAWKYTERGYRHLFWDAGMILANVLALAASVRLPVRVVLGFADAEVSMLLGLEERREFPLCLVAIGAADSEVPPAAKAPEEVSFRVLPLSRTEYVHEGILQANDAGRLDVPQEVRTWRRTVFARARPQNVEAVWEQVESTPPFSSDTALDSLEDVLRRRGSARIFAPGAIPATVLRTILERATVGIPTDYAPGGACLVEPYLIASAVQGGLDPGAYVFRDGEFRLLERGDFRREAGFLCLEQELGATAAATHFLMADLPRTLDALGARGYRAAQLEAGIVAGRLYLGAYAYRFGATGLTFYDDAVTEFFSPDAAGKSCVLVTAIGESPRLRRA
jgi:SagB-type dehydrogenase family enzyme